MKTPARLFGLFALAIALAQPCRGVVAVTWLDEPIVLWSEYFATYHPLDINADGFTDFVFGYDISFLGVRSEGDNQYLIWPSGGGTMAATLNRYWRVSKSAKTAEMIRGWSGLGTAPVTTTLSLV